MIHLRAMSTLVLVVAFGPTLAAQVPEALASQMPGLHWQGSSGTAVGTCFGFSCQALVVPVTAGETATLTVTGDLQMPYVLAVSTGANQCLTVPGIENSLALDPGLVILSMGILTDFNNLGPCGQAMVQFNATIPAGIPPGTEIAVQSVSYGLSFVNFIQSAPQFSTPLLLTF